MKALLSILVALPALGGIVSATFTDPLTSTPAATMSINTDTRQMSLDVLSPWRGETVGWQPTTVQPFLYTYWFSADAPPIVAPADMPVDDATTHLKLWKLVWVNTRWVQYQTDAVGSFDISVPEPQHYALGAGIGLLAFALRRKLKLVVPLLALATLALAEPVEVVTSAVSLKSRSYLVSANVLYGLDAGGTNVTMTQIVLVSQTDRSLDGNVWEKVATRQQSFTRAGVDQWVSSYTNAANVVVTNSIKTSFIADLVRIELLPTRFMQFTKVPQATEVVVPE